MATHDPQNRDVEQFFGKAWNFDFFQAVKELEAYARRLQRAAGYEECSAPGETDDPEDDPLRMRAMVSFGFRPSDMSRINLAPADGGMPVMWADFMVLCGARGPMPHFWAELIRSRERLNDSGLRDFLDIFNHRLLALFYRVRQYHRPTLITTRAEDHPFARFLASFSGVAQKAAQACFEPEEGQAAEDIQLSWTDLIYFSGMLWQRERSMLGLTQFLARFFGMEVGGREMCGSWMRLQEADQTMLTQGRHHNALGRNTVAGSRVYDPQSGFALLIGPVDYKTFADLLPTGTRFASLLGLTRFYIRNAFELRVEVELKAETVHEQRPGLSATGGPQLGWTSWALSRSLGPGTKKVSFKGEPYAGVSEPEPVEDELAALAS